MNRAELKSKINAGEWLEIGEHFKFIPEFMNTVTGKLIIDWRSVPDSVCSILRNDKRVLTKVEVCVPQNESSMSELRMIEHLGNGVVNLCSRILARELVGRPRYGVVCSRLASNKNLMTAGFDTGDAAEIVIGTVLLRCGIQDACQKAIEILKRTEHYKLYERQSHDKIVQQ